MNRYFTNSLHSPMAAVVVPDAMVAAVVDFTDAGGAEPVEPRIDTEPPQIPLPVDNFEDESTGEEDAAQDDAGEEVWEEEAQEDTDEDDISRHSLGFT